jgi:molecular chaperone GrpE
MEFGKAAVVQELLDVVDDFERSIEAAHSAGLGAEEQGLAQAFAAFSDGVGLVYAKLRDALSRAGVEVIEAVGHPFDEHLHEALMRQPAAEGQAPGLVVGEIQKGYRMGDRVLRHAKVIVSA